MPRMRPCWIIRQVSYLFVLITVLYFVLRDSGVSPVAISQPHSSPRRYRTRAIYEYTSLYRIQANHVFESTLNTQLLALENAVRISLPNEKDVLANKTIHQLATAESAAQFSAWVQQWRTNNPGWSHSLLTSAPHELLSLFLAIPAIASAYDYYPSIRRDLTKYLLLWYHGGLYTDIDTWERVSLKDCGPVVDVVERGRNVSLMIGVEIDEPFYSQQTQEELGWTRGFSFGTGVLWAPRRFDPVMRRAIVRSISHSEVQKRLTPGRGWMQRLTGEAEEGDLGEVCGRGMFTDAVLDFLSESLKEGHQLRDRDAGLEERVSWKRFKGLTQTIWLGEDQARQDAEMRGLAVLPINVWGNGQNHSGSGSFEAQDACVNHFYGDGKKWDMKWYERFFS